jgi:hypothetical protein
MCADIPYTNSAQKVRVRRGIACYAQERIYAFDKQNRYYNQVLKI